MEAVDVLRATREYLSDEARWTKGAMWRDCYGRPTKARVRASCACLIGAMRLTTHDRETCRAARGALFDVTGMPAIYFNDAPETTHADVLNALDRAIAAGEAKAA